MTTTINAARRYSKSRNERMLERDLDGRIYNYPGDPLWRKAGEKPSLDLRFADSKSLVDATTGQNLVTFSRASGATYVDSQGVIRQATTNLLLQSEDFSTTWTNYTSTDTTNTQIAPNGSLTADELIEDNTTDSHRISQGVTLVSGLSYVYSIYLKAATRSFAFVSANGTGTLHGISINLATGSVATAVGSPSNATATSVGNGWWRVSFAYTSGTSGSVQQEVRLSTDGIWANRIYLGDNTSRIYIWGAQLEQSSTVGEYVPTTSTINSAPRFDHNPVTGESLGLLVEEARTNRIRNNSMVGAVAGTPGTLPTNWSLLGGTGLTTQVVGTGAENGVSYIDIRFSGTTGNTFTGVQFDGGISGFVTGTAYTGSVYMRRTAGALTNLTNPSIYIRYNLSPGGQTDISSTVSSLAGTTASLATSRYAVTGTTAGTLSGVASMFVLFNHSSGVAVDITLRIGMPQLEQGAFATSVIPTAGTAATRSADVASISGSNFSSWYRQDEGTVFADLVTTSRGHSAYPRMVAILGSDVNNGNEASIYTRNLGTAEDYRLFGAFWDAVGAFADFNPGSGAPLGSGRVAMAIKNNDGGYCVNGASPFSDTSCSVPTPIQLRLFGLARFQPASSGYVRRLVYWGQRLPNNVLQAITQ